MQGGGEAGIEHSAHQCVQRAANPFQSRFAGRLPATVGMVLDVQQTALRERLGPVLTLRTDPTQNQKRRIILPVEKIEKRRKTNFRRKICDIFSFGVESRWTRHFHGSTMLQNAPESLAASGNSGFMIRPEFHFLRPCLAILTQKWSQSRRKRSGKGVFRPLATLSIFTKETFRTPRSIPL